MPGPPRESPGTPRLRGGCGSGQLVLPLILVVVSVLIMPVSGIVIVEYFHQPGCTYCEKTDPLIENLTTEYGDRIALDRIEIDDRSGVRLLVSYGVTEIPVVVINRNRVLTATEITPQRLGEEILLAESGAYPVPAERRNILSGDPILAMLFAFILGLMTGFSPCLLGSLVLLIAAAGGPAVTGYSGKYLPFVFGAGIITAYLIVAGGILGAGIGLIPDSGSRLLIYSAGGLTAIVVGLVQAGFLSLPNLLTRYTAPLVSRFRTCTGIFLLGIIFAVLFAPCAIAPFLFLIGTLLIDKTLAPVLMLPGICIRGSCAVPPLRGIPELHSGMAAEVCRYRAENRGDPPCRFRDLAAPVTPTINF